MAGVNLVNAEILAKNRGIEVIETKTSEKDTYIKVIAERNGKKFSIAGTVVNDKPVITEIEGYKINIIPEGILAITKHIDRPGVVGKVGLILGEYGVNIASMQVGRKEPGGEAVMVLSLDQPIPEEAIKKLKEIPNIKDIAVVKL